MIILSFKPGHDGHVSCIANHELKFSHEAEKDSRPRYAPVSAELLIESLSAISDFPDVVALSGWSVGLDPCGPKIGAGYLGIEPPIRSEISLLGRRTALVTSSHERSHLMCAYGMSPFPQGQPCYALVWEGHIGAFYRIDAHVRITKLRDVMSDPGIRYAFAYGVADSSFALRKGQVRLGDAGKMMALAAFRRRSQRTHSEDVFINTLLRPEDSFESLDKPNFRSSPYFNIGVDSSIFKNMAGHFSDAIFNAFFEGIKPFVNEKIPLLISGGCGLNCDWNSSWLNCGLFSDVFVPPCPNDAGSAIGTAIDAQHFLSGNAKIEWSVYAGQTFDDDVERIDGYTVSQMQVSKIAEYLHRGDVLGWVQGRAEIGPRALGNRSILAAPFSSQMQARINSIKRRENFRPVAPICLEETATEYFELSRPSPHMLYFARVKDCNLQAVTHVDGSARPQTVNPQQNASMHALLSAFESETEYGVLCNTSLNFNGAGFINRTSDLGRYATENGLDGFVVNNKLYRKNTCSH
jgi:hydroxymethyl cephem carbamoyltransferase